MGVSRRSRGLRRFFLAGGAGFVHNWFFIPAALKRSTVISQGTVS